MLRKRHPWVLLAAVVGFACDLPPIEYETEHLRIGTDSDEPICAGTLDELEARVRVVEDVLEVRVEEKLELYLFEGGVTGWCSEAAAGCYSRREKRVYTPLEHAGHEIVHAAVHQTIGGSDALFNEGFAVDLTGANSGFPGTYPGSNLGLSSPEVSRPTAGHFMRWLRESHQR